MFLLKYIGLKFDAKIKGQMHKILRPELKTEKRIGNYDFSLMQRFSGWWLFRTKSVKLYVCTSNLFISCHAIMLTTISNNVKLNNLIHTHKT